MPDFLKAMNVMGDRLVELALEKGCASSRVVECAREEMDALEAYSASEDSGSTRCEWLIDLIKGREPQRLGESDLGT